MVDLSLPAAAGAGILSFLSPCVLPLAPPYLCYLAGASMEALGQESETRARRDLIVAAALFVAGFSTVFIALGATASVFGTLLRLYSRPLSILAGIGIMAMGAHFLGLFRFGFLYREARLTVDKPPGLWAAYLMGLAFAFGWTPCIGPILAAILAVAGSQETVGRGALLLAAYAAGLGVPFLIAALAISRSLAFVRAFRNYFGRLEKAVGVALVLTGIAFLTGGVQAASGLLIEWFPRTAVLG